VNEARAARNRLFLALGATIVVTTAATLAASQVLGWVSVALGIGSLLLYLRWRRAVRRARLSSSR
jgi:hypothetical protein